MRKNRRIGFCFKYIFLILAAALFVILFAEIRLRPVISSVASLQARSLATAEINSAVADILDENGITSEMLEHISRDENGNITAVCTDASQVNRLKNLITLRVQDRLSNIRSRRVDVPVGNVLGFDLLSGTGPTFPVYISMSGTAESDFDSSFESGGINQTVHKLSFIITADINVVMPLSTASERVSTSVLAGETVIVGKTPGGMLYGRLD